MSKEYLEALEEIRDFRYGEDKLLVCQTEMYSTIKQALKRLESIDNANPSEALKELELVEDWIQARELKISNVIEPSLSTIKQALIKSQEQHLKDKAFELIILKNVDVNQIRPNATAEAYNSKIPYYRRPLTDDEFRFLKEMIHRLDCEEVVFELPKID